MPKILKINDEEINIGGTSFVGHILAEYDKLVEKFGQPIASFCGYKSDVEWYIEFEDGSVATIYNWKNGYNYCGESGLHHEDIMDWHIGGRHESVERWINDYVHHSWPVFDHIRQEAQI